MRALLVLFILSCLAGCSSQLPPVQYQGTVSWMSERNASVQLVKYREGETLDQIFDPQRESDGRLFPQNSYIRFGFDAIDERVFAESLATALTGNGVVKVESISDQANTKKYLSLQLVFLKSEWDNRFGQNFKLEAAIQLRASGRELRKIYKVSTYDNNSFWDRFSDNAQEGKTRAAENLMNRIVPDVETFLQLDAASQAGVR